MAYHNWGLVMFLHLQLQVAIVLGQSSSSNLILLDFYWCKDVPQQSVQIFIKPKDYNPGSQRLDINMSFPEEFGNDILGVLSLELNTELTAKDIWVPLFKTEEDLCKMMATYVGELWYDIQRKMGMIPRSCPIARGSYHAVNHLVEYRKLKLQGFPIGKTRVITKYVRKSTKETMACNVYKVSTKSRV